MEVPAAPHTAKHSQRRVGNIDSKTEQLLAPGTFWQQDDMAPSYTKTLCTMPHPWLPSGTKCEAGLELHLWSPEARGPSEFELLG